MIKPTNPAFPVQENTMRDGIDVRTYIATKVFAAVYASPLEERRLTQSARMSVKAADALIAALNEEKP